MNEKIELDDLSAEAHIKVQDYLSSSDLVSFAKTSIHYKNFFRLQIDTRKLLHYVAHGKYNEVERLLTTDINLLFQRGNVSDCAGRTFNNISAFEYALWALDKHMWSKILACIPQNETRVKIFAELLKQYNKISTQGITYTLDNKTITEKHFNFENTIIKALQEHINMINTLKNNVENIYDASHEDLEPIAEQWGVTVRAAQKHFPMHLVYEYCASSSYGECDFSLPPQPLATIYNPYTRKDENWFNQDEQSSWCTEQGHKIAAYKGDFPKIPKLGSDVFTAYWASQDLSFVTKLFEARTRDFLELPLLLNVNEFTVCYTDLSQLIVKTDAKEDETLVITNDANLNNPISEQEEAVVMPNTDASSHKANNVLSNQQLEEILKTYKSISLMGFLSSLWFFSSFISSKRSQTIIELNLLLNHEIITREQVIGAISKDRDGIRRLSLFNQKDNIQKNGTSTDEVIYSLSQVMQA